MLKSYLSNTYRKTVDQKIQGTVDSYKKSQERNSLSHKTLKKNVLSPLPPVKQEKYLTSINEATALSVYNDRCNEMEIVPNNETKRRFVQQFLGSFHKKSFTPIGLSLGSSCIRHIITLVNANPRFISIDLSLNRFKDDCILFLARFLSLDPPVIDLRLRSNGIGSTGTSYIFQGLTRNSHLVSLDFSAIDSIDRNKIGTIGSKSLSKALEVNKVLSILIISMCGITSDACLHIGKGLSKNSTLTYLDLSGNRFGTQGFVNLFQDQGSLGNIETLILSHNDSSDTGGIALCKALSENQTITKLDLSFNSFGKPFLKKLIDTLQGNSKIREISLAGNKFGPDCADLLHIFIRQNPEILSFDLSQNSLGDHCVAQIAIAVQQSPKIKNLKLSDTLTADNAASAIGKMLAEQNSLESLDLSSNTITDKGGIEISKGLESNQALLSLSLKDNEMKGPAAEHFISMLRTNKVILDIDITMNDFPSTTQMQLQKVIKEHKTITSDKIGEFAEQKINILKEKEQELFQTRDAINTTLGMVQNAQAEKLRKQQLLENLKVTIANEEKNLEQKIAETRMRYEAISEERRKQLNEVNKQKADADKEEREANATIGNLTSKCSFVTSRVERAEGKLLDAQIIGSNDISVLKSTLDSLKEQLKMTLTMVKDTKEKLLAKEQEEIRAKEEANNKEKEEMEEAARQAAKHSQAAVAEEAILTIAKARKLAEIKKKDSKDRKTKSKGSKNNEKDIVKIQSTPLGPSKKTISNKSDSSNPKEDQSTKTTIKTDSLDQLSTTPSVIQPSLNL